MIFAAVHESGIGTKGTSLIENFPGRRRGFGANMRGTLSLSDELTGEFRNEFDAMSISDLGLLRLLAGKLSPEAFGLLQHYPFAIG
jgi:hypothetical protein